MPNEFFTAASRDVAKKLDGIFVECSHRTIEESLSALQTLEEGFLRSSDAFTLEIRRRIAERRLAVAIQKGCSPARCSELFNQVKCRGFTDLADESLTTIGYCRHLLLSDAKQEVLSLLNDLRGKCSAIDVAADAEIADLIRLIDELIEECS